MTHKASEGFRTSELAALSYFVVGGRAVIEYAPIAAAHEKSLAARSTS
jgi:hypothetical protein